MNLSANRLFYWACLVFSLLLRACPVLAKPGGVGQALLGYDIAEIGLDGRTWIVSPAGDDDGEGTEADPLRTLQAAADRVEPGDTVLVRAGTYTNTDDHALVIFRRGGTAERWVRLANYPGETPTLQFDSLRGIKTEGASYLVIEGFRIIGAAADVDPQAAFDHAERFVGEDYSQTRFFGVGIRIDGRDSEPARLFAPHHRARQRDFRLLGRRHRHRPGGLSADRKQRGFPVQLLYAVGRQRHLRMAVRGLRRSHRPLPHRHPKQPGLPQRQPREVLDDEGVLRRQRDHPRCVAQQPGGDRRRRVHPALHRSGPGAHNICFLNGGRGINIYESDHIDLVHNTLWRNAQRENVKNEIELGRTHHTRIVNNLIVVAEGKRGVGGYQSGQITMDHNLIHGAAGSDFPPGEHTLNLDPRLIQPPPHRDEGPPSSLEAEAYDFAGRRFARPFRG